MISIHAINALKEKVKGIDKRKINIEGTLKELYKRKVSLELDIESAESELSILNNQLDSIKNDIKNEGV